MCLDISKAFDRVDHFALLQLLMERNSLKCFIVVLLEWFTKSLCCVRWNGVFSCWYCTAAGVRQRGLLSPILFAIYIDPLIIQKLIRR